MAKPSNIDWGCARGLLAKLLEVLSPLVLGGRESRCGTRADVALFLPNLHRGGAERVMIDLAVGLGARGFDVDLVVLRSSGGAGYATPAGVQTVELHPAASVPPQARPAGSYRRANRLVRLVATLLARVSRLCRYVEARRPRVMMSTLPAANLLALLVKLKFRSALPLVLRRANHYSLEFAARSFVDRIELSLERHLWHLGDAVVVNSRDVAADLLSMDGGLRGRLHLIRNPVVTSDFAVRAADPVVHQWFEPGQPPVVLAVGRLAKAKDHATLLRAFAIASRRRSMHLVVLGEGPERPFLERLAVRLGIAESVDLVGFEPNPLRYMAAAAVFVLSSTREGASNALVQAMACGTPLVCTDCAGSAEALAGGTLGTLVPVGDHRAMARALLETLCSPRDAKRLIRAARARYGADDNIDRYVSLLRAVSQRRVGQRGDSPR